MRSEPDHDDAVQAPSWPHRRASMTDTGFTVGAAVACRFLQACHRQPVDTTPIWLSGHVFNLGHGILPRTPVDNVRRLVDFVHAYRPVHASDER